MFIFFFISIPAVVFIIANVLLRLPLLPLLLSHFRYYCCCNFVRFPLILAAISRQKGVVHHL